MRIKVMPPARRQLRELAVWWRENRPAAPGRVHASFGRALQFLAEFPRLGRVYPELPGVRTYPLKGTPYHLFYEINEEAGVIEVVAVWSSMRGEGPDLG